MNKLVLLSSLAVSGAALGVPQAEAPALKPAEAPQQVTVSGSRGNDIDQRRNATAAKMIFGREELDRNGDSSVGEILKRLPGVTMGGPPGRGGAGGVRMRGLGNGYTQMLVNGERPPAGFSLESLAPDQVERIEIMRGAVAEHSTQAIAGTINIVLREGYQQKDLQLKLSDTVENGQHSPNVSLTMPGKAGALGWLLTGSVSGNRQRDQASTDYQGFDPAGTQVKDQTIATTGERDSRGLHLMPRFSYKFDNGDTLNFQPFLMHNQSDGSSRSTLVQRLAPAGQPPEYALALGRQASRMTFLRSVGNWVHKVESGGKLDVKFGFGAGRSSNEALRLQYAQDGSLQDSYVDNDSARNANLSTGGKFTRSVGQGHQLAAGWDAEAGRRTQEAEALVNGAARPGQGSGDLRADSRRLALFVQDEWDITPQWGVYLGLRWEGIRTTASEAAREVRNTSSVWSPVLHGVWRIPGREKDQIRASLTQSYRAPQLNDLVATEVQVEPNSPTRPDRGGNADLKPELAKGIDLAYEHYLGKTGIVSASAFVRNIDDLMRRTVEEYVDTSGRQRFISRPTNVGSARTSGLELEAKLQLADLMADAPNLDLRLNYSRFWSDVDGIPGPDNRLDGQARQSANAGADYRLKSLPLTLGGSYNWTPEVPVQATATERSITGVKRQVDVYGLWKFSSAAQLRLGANNARADDYLSGRLVQTGAGLETASTTTRSYTTWSARLEMKL